MLLISTTLLSYSHKLTDFLFHISLYDTFSKTLNETGKDFLKLQFNKNTDIINQFYNSYVNKNKLLSGDLFEFCDLKSK